MSKPKVLISDALSPAAVQIFKDRGVEVDFQPNLGKDKDKLARVYRDIALEAIRARPDLFVKIGIHRLLGSCNLEDLDDSRFQPDYFSKRLAEQIEGNRNPESMLRIAFGLSKKEPSPSVETFRAWTNPVGDSAASRAMMV